jgi:6-phospho-3-hexuloisomerase
LTPIGKAFELNSLVFLDGLVSELMNRLGKTENDLKERRTVLE